MLAGREAGAGKCLAGPGHAALCSAVWAAPSLGLRLTSLPQQTFLVISREMAALLPSLCIPLFVKLFFYFYFLSLDTTCLVLHVRL